MERNISSEVVSKSIFMIRGRKVMLDSDLAELYGVKTKELNKAVQRNLDRFPEDFMFQLSVKEDDYLRFQNGTSSLHGGRRYLPYVFTQEGVAMLSGILKSKKAVRVNIAIMRAFVRLREVLATHKDLARKLETLERKYDVHDEKFRVVFEAIQRLMKESDKPKRPIGFV